MRFGEIRYARTGDHHIAFCEVDGGDRGGVGTSDDGSGRGHEIVMVSGAYWPLESFATAPPDVERLIRGLAGLGRLILFDRRGVALSDPVTDWDRSLLDQWADDLAAVITEAGCERPTVFSWNAHPIAPACAVRRPDLVGRLVLFNPFPAWTAADMAWVGEWEESMRRIGAGEAPEPAHQAMPARARDPEFNAWNLAAGRVGASPSQAERLGRKAFTDPYPDFGAVQAPTLVITRRPDGYVVPAEFHQRPARQIPGAELVELPPGDATAVGVGIDDLLAEISRFVTGEVRLPAPDRQLTAILFTDLVGSTRRAVTAGDAGWRALLDRHDEISRAAVTRRGGEVVKTTGDGILALLPSATAAVDAARALRSALAGDDLEVRSGIHVGEVDRRGDDVSGIAVNTAARIMARAGAGQILASALVTQVGGVAPETVLGPTALAGIDAPVEVHVVG